MVGWRDQPRPEMQSSWWEWECRWGQRSVPGRREPLGAKSTAQSPLCHKMRGSVQMGGTLGLAN